MGPISHFFIFLFLLFGFFFPGPAHFLFSLAVPSPWLGLSSFLLFLAIFFFLSHLRSFFSFQYHSSLLSFHFLLYPVLLSFFHSFLISLIFLFLLSSSPVQQQGWGTRIEGRSGGLGGLGSHGSRSGEDERRSKKAR